MGRILYLQYTNDASDFVLFISSGCAQKLPDNLVLVKLLAFKKLNRHISFFFAISSCLKVIGVLRGMEN